MFLQEKGIKKSLNMDQIKNTIYKDLDDLIAQMEDVTVGKKIGVGASSEVFYGNYKYCPCAIKKINLELMNSKQIVNFLSLNFRTIF